MTAQGTTGDPGKSPPLSSLLPVLERLVVLAARRRVDDTRDGLRSTHLRVKARFWWPAAPPPQLSAARIAQIASSTDPAKWAAANSAVAEACCRLGFQDACFRSVSTFSAGRRIMRERPLALTFMSMKPSCDDPLSGCRYRRSHCSRLLPASGLQLALGRRVRQRVDRSVLVSHVAGHCLPHAEWCDG